MVLKKRRIGFIVGLVALVAAASAFGHYWLTTQALPVLPEPLPEGRLLNAPQRNRDIIRFVEAQGEKLAPTYEEAVCTEFVIAVIGNFTRLSPSEKKDIRIITNADLAELMEAGSPVIKGVQTALVDGDKGVALTTIEDVRPGDFVQFWNLYAGRAYGHCGVVAEVTPGRSVTVYSSHPVTRGYGKQKFAWPDTAFFVRLN